MLLWLSAAVSQAAEWDIDQLMRGLAQIRSGQASFIEKKSIAMLDGPVESSGELSYQAPDQLEKRTLKPKPESMLVKGNEVLIERGNKKYRFQLQRYPELAAVIDSIRGTLAGDRETLERNYQLSLEGAARQWTLLLLPTDETMLTKIKRIRIKGKHDTVRSIEVIQADGDSSLMLIEKMTAQ